MPERFAGKTFYTREEYEQINGTRLPPIPTEEERAAARAEWDEWARSTAPLPEGTPDYRSSPAYRDDLVGTEFEGWTTDPDTGEWRDAHGRPAYDSNGHRIRYPRDDTQPQERD
ncbi:hypothetical protein C5E45_23160 [Nocardia nova]|uniref:Uncharacterized protein n=1 Tax=Nocardia nova TaxID=37330 RepID=A0A2S6AL88_9NOCA|nr:hypothetical protein [Nocardia nova]PPJ31762.1 hypothetical protein C5E41_07700 [Nocardia nova]PPJ36001.1 hypothetical protein C5E45_23160 [Nocardia nova]